MRFLNTNKLSKLQFILGLSSLCLFIGITGISIFKIFLTDAPEKGVSKYLKAWKDNNYSERKKLSCLPEEVIDVPNLDIQSWDIREIKKNTKDIDSNYFSVFVKVNYVSNNSSIKRTIVFDVWNSEELFESAKRSLDEVDRKIGEMKEKVDSINKALGEPSVNYEHNPTILERDRYSLEKFCIHKVKTENEF